MLTEQEFKTKADETLAHLNRLLIAASDDYGFDVDFTGGALTVEFEEPPAKFVISPNAPPRQIWVSALSKSFKLDWDFVESAFVHADSGQTLKDLVQGSIGKHLREDVEL